MKRYRVWEANREIFLYPENWMEPEMRLGMSDLFQSLESDLLQGDVTDDLANKAFLNYLTGLELRARLDVVATYFDQNLTNAGISTLHVLARTYCHPHKYFYRTYTSLAWTPWIAVTPDIDGDHIALAIWKGRLNVFWITWITQTQAPSSSSTGQHPAQLARVQHTDRGHQHRRQIHQAHPAPTPLVRLLPGQMEHSHLLRHQQVPAHRRR